MTDGSNRETLFGREHEMAELSAALDDALDGRARFVAISGEAGIGKTRLAEALSARADKLGALVLSASSHAVGGAPPYWPWAQALTGVPDGESGRDDLIASLTDASPAIGDIGESESAVATFRLFESVVRFMASRAEDQPLVLVLEDGHWADDATTRLLEFVGLNLEQHRILIIATFRDTDIDPQGSLSQVLGNLARSRGFARIHLEGLSREDVKGILSDHTGSSPSERTVDEVMERTEGNPFFITEIGRELDRYSPTSPGGEPDVDAFWRDFQIPQGITQAIGLRLDHLAATTRDLLATAAILGRGFEFRELALAAPNVSEGDLITALEEALGESVIAPLANSAEGYQFSHALFQQTLMNELSPSRRVRLHASIAEALQTIYGPNADNNAEVLALHFRAAEPVLGPARALSYSLIAGDRALSAHAYGDALPHFEFVLERAGESEVDEDTLAAVNMGAGVAHAALRNIRDGLTHLSAAFEHYVEVEDRGKIAEIARCQLVGNQGMAGMIPIMERALSHLNPDGIDAARVLALYGRAVGTLEDDYASASKALQKSLAIARREKDLTLQFRCHALAANMNTFQMRYREMEEHVQHALRLAGAVDAPLEQAQIHILAAALSAVDGQHVEAQEHLQLGIRAAERAGNNERISSVSVIGLWIACNMGDWDEARAWGERSRDAWQDDPRALGLMAVVEFETGDAEAAESLMERVAKLRTNPQTHTLADFVCWVVQPHITRMSGLGDHVAEAANTANHSIDIGIAAPSNRFDADRAVAWDVAFSGDRDSAAEAYRRLAEYSEVPWGYVGVTSVHELLGNLARVAGDYSAAFSHFEGALRESEQAGFRRCQAWICHDYAATLMDSDERADRDRVAELVVEASSIAGELEMKPLSRLLAGLADRASEEAGAGFPDGLSKREVEVLGLIASGVPNREVAEQLFISPHTVVRHVANIYTKIGASNRAEAAIYAQRHGLLDE